MALHPQPHFSIAVRITTSSPILDLSQQTPFTITLALTLSHIYPITLVRRYATLFDGNLLYSNGLTFTNTATGELLPRNTRDMCYMDTFDDDTTPSEKNKKKFVTLHPGKEHLLHATLQPILSNSNFPTEGLTAQEIAERQTKLPKTWRWPKVAGMQDGEVYQVGLSEYAGISFWMWGSVETLVEVRRAGLKPEVRGEMVPFVLVESAWFEMRRQDTNGTLNWP